MPEEDAPIPVEDDAPIPIEEDAPIPIEEGDLEPLPLEGEQEGVGSEKASAQSSSKIHAFGSHTVSAQAKQRQFKRALNMTGTGATRCKLFHSKLTVAALDHMIEQINDWLDENEVEVKFVGQVVGTMEGKALEPNIIVTVWY